MITIRVPGTTANLGPGFDCLGCALSVYGFFSFEERAVELEFESVAPEYQNADNLAVRAYRRAQRALGLAETGLFVKIESDVPTSRGLGSSASLIVAGLVAANEAHGRRLTQDQLLTLATEMEGHPDNVAPALLGGMTASLMADGEVISMHATVSDRLRFCALIPDFELPTKLARQALPKQVPFADAVFNVSRATVLLRALEAGDTRAVGAAMNDRLHQPYRAHLIQDYAEIEATARHCGAAGFCLSGAGPTLLCVPETDDFEEKMRDALAQHRGGWRLLSLKVDANGATVVGEEKK